MRPRAIDALIEQVHQGTCPDCRGELGPPGPDGWHWCNNRCRPWRIQEISGQLYVATVWLPGTPVGVEEV